MNEQVMFYLRKPWFPPVVSGAIGIVAGATAMYEIQRRKLESVLDEAETEIEELKHQQLQLDFERAEKDREFNRAIGEAALVTRQLSQQGTDLLNTLQNIKPVSVIGGEVLVQPTESNVAQEVPQPELAPDHLPEPIPEEGKADQRRFSKLVSSAGEKVSDAVETVAETVTNIFDHSDDWDYEHEQSTRNPDEPYVIHVDEYVADEMGWDSQSTLTWYEGDAVLTDSNDVPIYNGREMVGDLRFGHGSGDPNVVFIRNEKLKAEYEVIRDLGSYEEVVLGGHVEAEYESSDLKHSRSPRKFRQE